MTAADLHRASGADISAADLYDALRLRAAVFVVEQECAYLDPDGHDLAVGTDHLWIRADDGSLAAYLRVLCESDGPMQIGRVVTHPQHRGAGLSGRLLDAALDGVTGAVVLSAQSHLTAIYERHGFAVDGPEFLDDGIRHTPMRRPAPT